MTDLATTDRRGADRRVRRVSFRYPERRTGFDRRTADRSRRRRVVDAYRRRPHLVAGCVAAIVALSAADLALTLHLMGRGATEVNPVMAGLLAGGPVPAAALKAAVTLPVAGGIWALRRHRAVLEFSLCLVAALVVLIGYQAVVAAVA